jgi:FkbM family methyltransferase
MSLCKRVFEKITGATVFRDSLPRGVSLERDLRRIHPKNMHEIWDVGAHKGETAVRLHSHFTNSCIRSFEPARANYKALLDCCSSYQNQFCYNFAFGPEERKTTMQIRSVSVLNSLAANLNLPEEDDLHSEQIEVRTIDSFLGKENIESIDLLKIDVEGYEKEVLHGARNSLTAGKIKFLYLETGIDERFVPFSELIDELEPFNIYPYAMYEQTPHWSGKQKLWYWNALFAKEKYL